MVHVGTVTILCMLRCFSHVRLCAILWTIASQAPLSMGFSRQEYWSGFPTQGLNPHLFTSPALAGRFFTTSATWEGTSLGRLAGGEADWAQLLKVRIYSHKAG